LGLKAPFRDGTVQDVAKRMLAISAEGLKRRAIFDGTLDEVHFLDSLMEIAESGMTPADILLEKYRTTWKESVDPVFTEFAF
jgi:glutamate--cysteine ligase